MTATRQALAVFPADEEAPEPYDPSAVIVASLHSDGSLRYAELDDRWDDAHEVALRIDATAEAHASAWGVDVATAEVCLRESRRPTALERAA